VNRIALLTLICLVCVSSVFAQNTAQVKVLFSVPEVTMIKVNQQVINLDLRYGNTSGLIYEPKTVTGSYNISSTGATKKIYAQLDTPMPSFMYLDLMAVAPTQAHSLGYVTLSAVAQPIVSNVRNVNQQNLLLNFRLRAELGAPTSPSSQQRIVTLTISD